MSANPMNDARLHLMEAITFKRTISAIYNGTPIKLAPHLLFERHGDLFISALNLSKSWSSDGDRKLGQFKLAGLKSMAILGEEFSPLESFDFTPPRADDTVILAI